MFKFKVYTVGDIKHHVFWVSKKFSVSIHKIIYREWLADEYPHDHWLDFLSIILWGGYTEELFRDKHASNKDGEIVRRRWASWHIMKNSSSHKVIRVHPRKSAWTLFITWNYQKGRKAYIYTDAGPLTANEYYSNLAKEKKLQDHVMINEKPSSIKNKKFLIEK